MHIFATLLILWAGIFRTYCNPLIEAKSKELYDTLLTGYYKDIQPCFGCVSPLAINLTYHLTSLNDLDEVAGEMKTMGFLTVKWLDTRLSWNPADYGGIATILMPFEKIWSPKLMVGNPSLKVTDLNGDLTMIRLVYYGLAIWTPGDVFRTRCYADIYRFPFDKQECYISFIPWGYLVNEIILTIPENTNPLPFFENNGEWVIDKMRTESYVEHSFSLAKFFFSFRRRPQFFVVNVILPIMLLCFLNCLVFVIPVRSGERISYGITVLLSFAVFMTLVGDNIPKTSDPLSLLSFYLLSVFALSTLIMVCAILNISIYHRDPEMPISAKYRFFVSLTKTSRRCHRKVVPGVDNENAVTLLDPKHLISQEGDAANFEPMMIIEEKITWVQVSRSLDKICLIVYIVFFTAATVIQLSVIKCNC